MRRTRLLAAAAVSALAAGTLSAVPSAADPLAKPSSKVVLARHLVGPLSLAVEGHDVYVTQDFAGVLNKLRPGKKPKTLYAASRGNGVGGVSVRNGRIVFTETSTAPDGSPGRTWLKKISRSGEVTVLARIRAYENRKNPDGRITYGVRGIRPGCADQWPTAQFGPPVYQGIKESNPYATYQTKRKVYVADAAMNAVLSVGFGGRIRTIAVTPAVPVRITEELQAAIAEAFGAELPDCVVGMTYYGESVPTDVELGRGGKLYVSTLGGGLGELVPLGAVFRVDRTNGHKKMILDHLTTPTGIAISPRGGLLIAELFANRIASVRHGSTTVRTFAKAKLPAAVEIENGRVYATTNVLPAPGAPPDGRVVRYIR